MKLLEVIAKMSFQKDLIWVEKKISISLFIDFLFSSNDEDKFAREIMYTRIEEKEWKIECERAVSLLKVRVRKGGKEWRSHIEKTKKYLKDIKKILPGA